MDGSIRTTAGFVSNAGITLIRAQWNRPTQRWTVMVRTNACIDDVEVLGMDADDETTATEYAEQVAVVVWGGATAWTE